MKNFITGTVLAAVIFVACNNTATETNTKVSDTTKTTTQPASTANNQAASMQPIVQGYLKLKNALTTDNANAAAAAGKEIVVSLAKVDASALRGEQKKAFEDIKDDAKENAEHIGDNAGKIEHQREHFDMLSKDIYSLVKAFPADQELYADHCPMYNGGKGAIWISETKEIKNPYLGSKMPTCGTIKETIKKP